VLVLFEVHPVYGRQGGDGLLVHVAEQEAPEQVVLGGLVDQPVAGQVGEVAQGLVTAVQQASFSSSVRSHYYMT
jgi:hypothetical protein